ncbi:hypothetical protein Naga_100438g1 [Nannochloropsis gaditana]|uniref:Uncharacterized protein n=1 Tax=Nannochloropsis gaditana TaxID=72520 RepID=W7U3T1_9STRA|nr:hypothetical protein Naga_100438g1 [Nannochloropsis gaditana]
MKERMACVDLGDWSIRSKQPGYGKRATLLPSRTARESFQTSQTYQHLCFLRLPPGRPEKGEGEGRRVFALREEEGRGRGACQSSSCDNAPGATWNSAGAKRRSLRARTGKASTTVATRARRRERAFGWVQVVTEVAVFPP